MPTNILEQINFLIDELGIIIFVGIMLSIIASLCIIIAFFAFMDFIKRNKVDSMRLKNIDLTVTKNNTNNNTIRERFRPEPQPQVDEMLEIPNYD